MVQKVQKLCFLSITLFWRFFHKSMYGFRNPHKITDFFIPMKAYLEQIFFDPIKGILSFFRSHYHTNSQSREKCLLYFGLWILTLIQSYIPPSWISKKAKIRPTLLYSVYSTTQCTLYCMPYSIQCTAHGTLYCGQRKM